MRNPLLKDGLFDYCIMAPSHNISERDSKERQVALFAINSTIKDDIALKLLKCYQSILNLLSIGHC